MARGFDAPLLLSFSGKEPSSTRCLGFPYVCLTHNIIVIIFYHSIVIPVYHKANPKLYVLALLCLCVYAFLLFVFLSHE
jgi:hypothetical protein